MGLIRFLFVISLGTCFAIASLWHVKAMVRAGYEITSLEEKLEWLKEKNRRLETEISALRAPNKILKNLEGMDLKLLPPEGELTASGSGGTLGY